MSQRGSVSANNNPATPTNKEPNNNNNNTNNNTANANNNNNADNKIEIDIIGPYQIGKTIGQGIFAKVKLGEDEFRQKVAIKIFDKQSLSKSKHQLLQVEKEINALRTCRHNNIVQYYEVLETETNIYLVMEYLQCGELYDYILSQGHLSEPEAAKLFIQICSALQYCHERGIVHRDLKPENILLTKAESIVKLVDFGLANYIDNIADPMAKTLRTQCGSPHYASPEILTGHKYSGIQADVWLSNIT
jgi:serine/threonine protein kinase